jgi:hypothetical protein
MGFEFEKDKQLVISILGDRFSNIDTIILKDNFVSCENHWKSQTISLGLKKVKYLFICEAPPFTQPPFKYFYDGHSSSLLTRVMKAFIIDEGKMYNSLKIYKELAQKGFLLVDSLPYAIPFSTQIRKKENYKQLVNNNLNWWINKLEDHFLFDENLKIAFGFKLNALKIIESTNNKLKIGKYTFDIDERNIATDGSGMPNSNKLKKIFNLR